MKDEARSGLEVCICCVIFMDYYKLGLLLDCFLQTSV